MHKKLAVLLVILVLLLSACGGGTTAEPTAAPAPPTQAPVVEPTATPVPPTNTPVPPTDTPVPPTDTPAPPTDTPVPPTEAPTEPPAATEEPSTGGIPMIPHAIDGMEDQCLTCHGPEGLKPVPADHEGRTVDTCVACHAVEDGATSISGPAIPHAVTGMEGQCLTCHGPEGVKPVPADHEGRTVDTCVACHAVEDGATSVSGPAIPHAIAGMEGQCLTCHGPTGVKPAPADHEGRPVDTCTTCHQPES